MRKVVLLVGCLAVVVVMLKVPLAVETPAAQEPTLRTSWGEPDLQGLWVHDSEIPLQRPPEFADQEFFTDEQIADIDRRRAGRLDHDYRAAPGTPNDVSGAYNAVFHLRKPTGRRTSLIIDPPDGRMPAFTSRVLEERATLRQFRLALLQASPACENNEPSCSGERRCTGISPMFLPS